MINKWLSIIGAALLAVAVAGLFVIFGQLSTIKKELAITKDELIVQKKEHVKTLEELKKSLEENAVCLKRDLVRRYLDYILELRNKIDSGFQTEKSDADEFTKRADFIVENLGTLELSNAEATLYLSFISSLRKTIEESQKKNH